MSGRRLRGLASRSLGLFGARLFGAGCAFLAQALIARALGPAVLGDYLLVMAAANVAAACMPLGFQMVGGYFAATYRAAGDDALLRAYLKQACLQIVAMAALIGLAALLAAPWLGAHAALIAPGGVIALASAFIYLSGGVLVGLKRPFAGMIGDVLVRPVVALAVFAVIVAWTAPAAPLPPALWALALALAAVAVVQMRLMLASLGRGAPPAAATLAPARRAWWRYALPWAVIALATDFFLDIDLVLLAPLLDREAMAVFGVCARIAALIAFGIGSIYTLMMPHILDAGVRRDSAAFAREVGDANLVAVAIALALSVAMFAAGPLVALLFGDAFAGAGLPLGIMTLGLAVRAALGPAALVLSFHDRPAASLPAALIGLLALVTANLLLVPSFGLIGAALAAALAMTAWSAALWLTAWRGLSIDVSVLPRVKRLLAARREA